MFLFNFFFLFLIILWPYLWSDPINNFFELFKSVRDDLVNVKILYDGSYVSNRTLPDYYLLEWIAISSPLLQITLSLFGFFYCFVRFIKRFITIKEKSIYNDLWRGSKEELDFICLLFLISFYFFFIFFNAPLYNGWRLVYFLNIFLLYFSINFLSIIEIILVKKLLNKVFYLIIIS